MKPQQEGQMEVRQRPLGRDSLGRPVKPPQGAVLSRDGTERCGKGVDDFFFNRMALGII